MEFIELIAVNGTQLLINVSQIVAVRKYPNAVIVDTADDNDWPVTESYDHVRDAICAAGCVVVRREGEVSSGPREA